MTNEKVNEAPEQVFLKACHPDSPNHNCTWSVSKEAEDSVRYVRADLLAITGKKDAEIAQGIVREWAEHDMNEHYNSEYLRDEFGSEHLEQRIVTALATARKEETEAAFKEAVKAAGNVPSVVVDVNTAVAPTRRAKTATEMRDGIVATLKAKLTEK